MTYAQAITSLRNQTGDTRRRAHIDWTGDGTTTGFQMPTDTFPVLDQSGTYVVKVAGVTKTEGLGSDYTLDKETGTLVFTVAPVLNAAITLDCSSVYLTDASWLDIINKTIYSLGDDFWKEFTDDTLLTTANMLSLSLVSSIPKCIAVYEFWYRPNVTVDWRVVEEFTNWRYDRENNIIYFGNQDAFPITGQLMKVRGLKGYTLGTVIGDTLDLQDKFLTVLEYGAIARYWKWRYKSVVEMVSKLTTEPSRTPLQELIMLSDRFDRLYEIEKGKLKPQKPPRVIPPHKNGGGRP